MKFLQGLFMSVSLAAAWGVYATDAPDSSCEREASWAAAKGERHFMVLAAAQDVFFDKSGPSFVMLMKADVGADEAEMGAVGVYADDQRRAVFGALPRKAYDAFLREPGKRSRDVLLRFEITEPQYARVLDILQSWDHRARDNQLLYRGDAFMNNILLVKQVTEELNRCREAINLYKLDWGVEDKLSDENPRSYVPLLVFEELKRRNASLHVPDSKMPVGLIRPRS